MHLIRRRLVDREVRDGRLVSLVEEELVADLRDDDIPRIDGARCTHDGSKKGVRHEDIPPILRCKVPRHLTLSLTLLISSVPTA